MNAWISFYNIQMANNLMKWWRTKFLSGYKQFSVDCNEGRISDTEELLGRLSPENEMVENRAACTTPPLLIPPHTPAQQSTPAPHDQVTPQQLNLEEFSCDVSVGAGLDKSGQERQEFSFTLYDFDGHGKITKDDIASLVTTIYEVLGSSVKVPHYGSKTIRVKLTVSPDQKKHVSATVIQQNEKSDEKQQPADAAKREANARQEKKTHCRKSSKHKERRHERHCCSYGDNAEENSDDSDCSAVSGGCLLTDDEDGGCSDDQLPRCNQTRHKKATRHANPRYTVPNLFIRENNMINRQDGYAKPKKLKKRSSSLQRQELLEIIQANMDKNNLSFQTARKPCNNHTSLEAKPQPQEEKYQQHKHRHETPKIVPSSPLHCLANIVDPTHFYVDLASLQNTTHLPDSNCQYNKLINAVMCVSNKKVPVNRTQGCKKHNLPTSNIPVRSQILDKPLSNIENVIKRSKKGAKLVDSEQTTAAFKKNIKKFPHAVLGHTSSPHHMRHRNRQEDQARAMAQVVRWLEQEFSNVNAGDKKENGKSTAWSNNQEKHTTTNSTAADSSVERHEHHHVHEHIHHHYHHYQETPIVV